MAGLSLVELMISMALGLIILAAVTTVFSNTSASRNELERTSRQIENGRYAVEILSDDLRLAGFFGELNPAAASPLIAVPATLPDPCSTAVADLGTAMRLHIQGYDGGTTGPPTCVTNLQPGTDIVVVRRAKTCVAGPVASPGCQGVNNDLPYLQVSLCGTETISHTVALGSAALPHLLRNCSTAAGLRQYLVHIYFISSNNGAGQSIPTLKRMELTGAGTTFMETPLVEGIEQLNLEYGIDTNGDGNADAYTANPASVADWSNVVTARFHLLARNIDASPGYTDNKTYNLGLDAAGAAVTYTPGGSFRRHVYSGLVRIVNPAGRRDTP